MEPTFRILVPVAPDIPVGRIEASITATLTLVDHIIDPDTAVPDHPDRWLTVGQLLDPTATWPADLIPALWADHTGTCTFYSARRGEPVPAHLRLWCLFGYPYDR